MPAWRASWPIVIVSGGIKRTSLTSTRVEVAHQLDAHPDCRCPPDRLLVGREPAPGTDGRDRRRRPSAARRSDRAARGDLALRRRRSRARAPDRDCRRRVTVLRVHALRAARAARRGRHDDHRPRRCRARPPRPRCGVLQRGGRVRAPEERYRRGHGLGARGRRPIVLCCAGWAAELAAVGCMRPRWLLGLVAIAIAMAVFGVLDVREAFHQSDENKAGLVILAAVIAALHFAAAGVSSAMANAPDAASTTASL